MIFHIQSMTISIKIISKWETKREKNENELAIHKRT